MGNYIITQQDKEILYQNSQDYDIKLELLNKDFKVIDSLEGDLINCNLNIDANSDIRRTFNSEIHVANESYLVGSDKKIWLDKYVRPYIGIRSLRSGNMQWYKQGVYTMIGANYTYDQTTNTLSLQCNDLISTLNDDRDGQMLGYTITIEEGNNARAVIISLLGDAGITKYLINDIDFEIPYDLEFNAGVTYYEILSKIIELYSGFEMFFDIDGIFTIQKIPTCETDDIMLSDEFLKKMVISESPNYSFTDVYNYIQVYGQVLEFDRASSACTYSNNVYNATITDLEGLENFGLYSIMIPSTNSANPKMKVNNGTEYPITYDDGTPLKENELKIGSNIFKFRLANENFYYLGQYQVSAEVTDNNPNSPYNPINLGRIVPKTLAGGEYDNIYSDSLALQRADYELWKATRLQESVTLTMLKVPWLDVNWKIEYSPDYLKGKETHQYIIKSISSSYSDYTMNVEIIKFYPDYPDIT